MKINFKQPKYVLPVILLPFICFFFYVWHSSFSKPKQVAKENTGLSNSVGEVATGVRKKQLTDKLNAYKSTYKEADGLTAVAAIPALATGNAVYHNDYSDRQKYRLDSIQQAMKIKFGSGSPQHTSMENKRSDQQLAQAVAAMSRRQTDVQSRAPNAQPAAKEKDPMDIFRQQMAIMDSVNKQNDPAYREELRKKQIADQAAKLKDNQVPLLVKKTDYVSGDFNTLMPEKETGMISAVIDENITGYAGSRLRLRLLEDISAGHFLVKKGTYLYAQVSGFTQQRVTLAITSILNEGRILPVKLQVYDMDGLPGLYVPSSAFRDFTRDLGSNSVQGVTVDGSSSNSQFVMSMVSKMFQSTSSAIADLIRKNKARLKYNSYLYLVDPDALQQTQKQESLPASDAKPLTLRSN